MDHPRCRVPVLDFGWAQRQVALEDPWTYRQWDLARINYPLLR